MDVKDVRNLGEYDTVLFKTATATGASFLIGTVSGAIAATWHDVPAVERNQALPALLKTTKVMGWYGRYFATVGGVFALTDALAEQGRGKKDIWNGVLGGIAAGGVVGLRVGKIPAAIGACAALAAMSAAVDASGQVSKTPTPREYVALRRKVEAAPAQES
eukprot:TRINITY_DN586_c2_g1_i1.p1 TRINITY_DN586_c2_g1~~TRINITY_DN586_c2_g1_i1.p1  ORF type:complete len:161 (+),score=15.28 TRINITY_DN586_c2_g1_i1:173-655(+)